MSKIKNEIIKMTKLPSSIINEEAGTDDLLKNLKIEERIISLFSNTIEGFKRIKNIVEGRPEYNYPTNSGEDNKGVISEEQKEELYELCLDRMIILDKVIRETLDIEIEEDEEEYEDEEYDDEEYEDDEEEYEDEDEEYEDDEEEEY